MDVKEVLRKAVEEHASDIFIIAGLPISYRSNNVIIKEEGERLMPPETENYLEQIYELADHRDIDRLLKHGVCNSSPEPCFQIFFPDLPRSPARRHLSDIPVAV